MPHSHPFPPPVPRRILEAKELRTGTQSSALDQAQQQIHLYQECHGPGLTLEHVQEQSRMNPEVDLSVSVLPAKEDWNLGGIKTAQD